MPTAAFVSKSKRGGNSSSADTTTTSSTRPPAAVSNKPSQSNSKHQIPLRSSDNKLPHRRSRSVSAFSRTIPTDIDSECPNVQDNPLFWTAASPSPDGERGHIRLLRLDDVSARLNTPESSASSVFPGSSRGRSVSRNSSDEGIRSAGCGAACWKDARRSLSRIDAGRRRRSLSRGHYSNSEMFSQIPHWEDGRSMGFVSEAEEKTVQPITDMKTSTRNSSPAAGHMLPNVIPLDMENHDPVGSVLDVRGEYSRLLEECQDRARKLRAELAVEEHRGLELSKILKEITAEVKTPSLKKPRAGQKARVERRKISKRLEEEAMAYFDECVSISTFEGSDFSSFEDLALDVVGTADPSSERVNIGQQRSGISDIYYSALNQEPSSPSMFSGSNDGYALTDNSSIRDPSCRSTLSSFKTHGGLKSQFSIVHKSSDASKFEEDMRNYARLFSKENAKASDSCQAGRSGYHGDVNECLLKVPTEKFLLERIAFKKRIESGSLVMCGSSAGFPSIL